MLRVRVHLRRCMGAGQRGAFGLFSFLVRGSALYMRTPTIPTHHLHLSLSPIYPPPPLGLSIACPSASVSSAPHTHSSRFSRAGGGRNSSVPSNPSNPSNPFHIQTLQSLLYKTVMALFVLAFCNSSSSGVYYITKVTGASNRWTHGCPRFFCNNGHVRPPFLFSSGRRRRKTRTRIAKRPYARRHKQRGRTGGREDPPPPPVTAGRYN